MGVGLPALQRDLVAGSLEGWREAAPELRWVAPANLHLTLLFLGGVEPEALERLAAGLREIPAPSFELRLGGLGSFGRASATRVVWLGVLTGAEALAALAAEVGERGRRVGFPPEARPYSPHLTLARARDRRGTRLPALAPSPELPPWRVTSFNLYRSRPGRGGSVYTVLEEFGG